MVKPAAVWEPQNGTPQGSASSPGHRPCHPTAHSWDSAAPLPLHHYSAIVTSCQWYGSVLPGTECRGWAKTAGDCHSCFPLPMSWMSGGALVLFPPSSFQFRSYLASFRIAPNKPSLSSFNTAITGSQYTLSVPFPVKLQTEMSCPAAKSPTGVLWLITLACGFLHCIREQLEPM